MFKEENLIEGKNLEAKIPKDPFAEEVLVVFNSYGRFGDENDQLMIIDFRRYGRVRPGTNEKKWHYTGTILSMKKVRSKGLQEIPYETHMIYDVPEDKLITRERLVGF